MHESGSKGLAFLPKARTPPIYRLVFLVGMALLGLGILEGYQQYQWVTRGTATGLLIDYQPVTLTRFQANPRTGIPEPILEHYWRPVISYRHRGRDYRILSTQLWGQQPHPLGQSMAVYFDPAHPRIADLHPPSTRPPRFLAVGLSLFGLALILWAKFYPALERWLLGASPRVKKPKLDWRP